MNVGRVKEDTKFLICENKLVYVLLMMSAGMMGAYTFCVRGGVFCNAQTANIVIMSIAFGKGNWLDGFYYLIPIGAYLLGAIISEALPSPVKSKGFLRWDTYLIAIEWATLFLIGFIPVSLPHQIVQVAINFIASMQYNTFRQAEGIPMATTFCTNHVRQVGIAIAKVVRKNDEAAARRGKTHLLMLASFLSGGILVSFASQFLVEKAIWLALVPLSIILISLIYADLTVERDCFDQKPCGH